jgi:hypothetical protein
MIMQSTRIGRAGGVDYLARHLLDKTNDNDKIEILAGDRGALYDAQALAEGKRCKFSVRHLSISPEREMSPAQLAAFVRAIDAEFHVGPDRPKLIVRHVKHGRSHFHVAIAEVDPTTLRVLDCRNDYARFEDLARRYEADHGEHVQRTRTERKAARVEGFSDVARKRAERVSPDFDRTRLKRAFAAGAAAFHAELKRQGLRIADGDKGQILITSDDTIVSAANRAVGIKRAEFQEFMKGIENERVIGSQTQPPGHAREGRTQHHAAPTSVVVAGNAGGRPRQDRAVDRPAAADPRHAASTGRRAESRHRQARSPLPALIGRRREEIMLARLNRELDDLLRRAQEFAEWIASIFEPEASRLSREIAEAKKQKSFPHSSPPAATRPPEPSYHFGRRTTL